MMPLGNILMPKWYLTTSQFAVIVSSYSLAAFVSSFGAIFFADKFDRKKLLLFAYAGFLIPVFSALRLAKFNIDTRQTEDFIGLNTPMNTFLVISLPYLQDSFAVIGNLYFLLGLIALLSNLLVSELRLFSMKISNLSWAVNKYKFIFLIVSIVLLAFLKFAAIPIILILYILISQIHFKYSK